MIPEAGNLRVERLDKDQRRQVYANWMKVQFPRDELKPLAAIEQTIRKGLYEAWGMWDGEELVAYAFLGYANPCSAVLLDYYGVRPDMKHRGYGSTFLQKLIGVYENSEAILIESENPDFIEDEEDRQTAFRRMDFYRRNGCSETSLKVRLFGVEFNVLVLPADRAYEDINVLRRRYEDIYKGFLSNCYFNKFVRTRFEN